MSDDKKVLFVEWCAQDALGGTLQMEPMTELAYRRILDMIYASDDSLIDDDAVLQYSTKTGAKWKAIKRQLIDIHKKIYVENGFIRNRKCTEKLEKSWANISQKSEAGKLSAEKRKSLKNNKPTPTAVATPVPTIVPTNQEPNNQYPIKEEKKEARAPKTPKPEDVSETVWKDFNSLRKTKKAPVTETALNGIRKEAEIAGISLDDALREVCSRGWQGFKAEWYLNAKGKSSDARTGNPKSAVDAMFAGFATAVGNNPV